MEAVRQARRSRLEGRRPFEPIPTESPVDDPTATARRQGVRSIERHFSITRRIVLPALAGVVVLLASLPFLDQVPAALASLLIGGGTVLVGVAARPFVENALSGLAISSSRLVSIGDTVLVDGFYGTIEDVTLTHTVVKIWDWRRYVIPNARMLSQPFVSASLFDPYVWASVEFWVAYDADLARVRALAIEAARKSPAFGGHEEPAFWILELAKEGTRCWVAAWADTPSQAWQLAHDTRTALFEGFQREGIAAHTHRFAPSPPVGEPPRG
jgi:small-conductance mechanosensitive channel